MSVDQQKLNFLLNEFTALLQQLDSDTKGKWGLMNAQQMVEHFIWSVKCANGKLQLALVSESDHLEKTQGLPLQ